jgi:hypothetical protein
VSSSPSAPNRDCIIIFVAGFRRLQLLAGRACMTLWRGHPAMPRRCSCLDAIAANSHAPLAPRHQRILILRFKGTTSKQLD